MSYETALSYFTGVVIVLFCAMLFSVKAKGLIKLFINAVTGAFMLVALSVFTPLNIPLNALNAFITGALGLPGAILIIVIAKLL